MPPHIVRRLRRWILPALGTILALAGTAIFVVIERSIYWSQYESACDNRVTAIRHELDAEFRQAIALQALADGRRDGKLEVLRRFMTNLPGRAGLQERFYLWNGRSAEAQAVLAGPEETQLPAPFAARLVGLSASTGTPAAAVLPGRRALGVIAESLDEQGTGAASAVLVTFDIAGAVEAAIGSLRPSGIHLSVYDEMSRPVHHHRSRANSNARLPDFWIQPRSREWVRRYPVSIAGAHLTVECAPVDHFLAPFDVASCWSVLALGLLLTGLTDRLVEKRRRESAHSRELADLQLHRVRQDLELEVLNTRIAEASLHESEERFRRAYMDAAVGVIMIDLNACLSLVNRAICSLSGFEEAELIGTSIYELLAEDDREPARNQFERLWRGAAESYHAECRVRCKDGAIMWMRASVSVLVSDGQPVSMLALLEDISEQVAIRSQLEYQATHDRLTGLYNRHAFETVLARLIESAGEGRRLVGLLYIDLDGFKFINDSLGHAVGDLLLPAVASRLHECCPGTAVLARVGGDEFTITLQDIAGEQAIRDCAAAILAALTEPFQISRYELFIGASIGLAMYPRDGRKPDTLVKHADTAMYEAKRNGKSQFCLFTPALAAAADDRLMMENDLRRALDRGEIQIHFQPLVRSQDGALVRFEALCRWLHPERGYISPERFIPIAEETGLIVPIGRWMLIEGCRHAKQWNDVSPFPIQVAVNISAVQLAQRALLADVSEILRTTGLPPALLELEITESVMMRDAESSIRMLDRLRRSGVSIALDDFGTGYSSLSQLRRIPLDTLKIDRSFIQDLRAESQASRLVAALVSLAHGIGLGVVTEGVEQAEQAAILRHLGCDVLQGFLFGRPAKPEEALRLVREMVADRSQDELRRFASHIETAGEETGEPARLTSIAAPLQLM
jgi:diguanylate cyclase (GGDEF)-like protein/PAS domain S-box-containing protein